MSKNRLFYHCTSEGILVDHIFRHKHCDAPIKRDAAIQHLMVKNNLSGKQALELNENNE